MGQSIPFKMGNDHGILSLVDTDFQCPDCGQVHSEDDYFARMQKSKYGLIYCKCKQCRVMLGVTTDMRGDVKVWIKSEEKK